MKSFVCSSFDSSFVDRPLFVVWRCCRRKTPAEISATALYLTLARLRSSLFIDNINFSMEFEFFEFDFAERAQKRKAPPRPKGRRRAERGKTKKESPSQIDCICNSAMEKRKMLTAVTRIS